MRETAGVVLAGGNCRLVPYEAEHINTYHDWMKDPWLQEMTASEPLSMEEEVAMQQEWASDPEKCTFIVEAEDSSAESGFSMAGDVNLFILDAPEDTANTVDAASLRCKAFQPREVRWEQHSCSAAARTPTADGRPAACLPRKVQAEVMVMVAEERFRRQGLARTAVQRIMLFALTSAEVRQRLQVTSFVAKISSKNAASIKLFKSLGFIQTAEVPAFEEVHFIWWPHTVFQGGQADEGGSQVRNVDKLLQQCAELV